MIYRVRKSWENVASQIGAFNILSNAILACQEGYKVYDNEGSLIYSATEQTKEDCPYQVPIAILRRGSVGNEVRWLQWQLIHLGFYCGAAGVDGDFGSGTEKGVRNYQETYNLEIDGVCGPLTRASIKEKGRPSVEPSPGPSGRFIPRFSLPEKGNLYYNRVQNGGYSTAIQGKPVCQGLTVLNNCVGWASSRFNEIIGQNRFVYFNYPPNAEDFISQARAQNLEVSNEPSLGAIIVWAKGVAGNPSDGAGHVAVVEQINEDGSIITSESGYNCATSFWTTRRTKEDGNWGQKTPYKFIGFIKNPSVK